MNAIIKGLSSLLQLFFGVVIGISLLAATAGGVGYYFLTKLSAPPAKPVFAEEKANKTTVANPADSATETEKEAQPKKEKLPPGAYQARVTWPQGLSLRDTPSEDANRIGGIAFNKEIIILEESDDQNWQKVRIPDTDEEGWVKGGNVEKI
ncbi:MAG: SH3 domain-containing protein [Oscillatoria sp. PMC 1051.18]|nr:SH3 domain-containing protein [Oscillatoria sp. PMC 1050.18]MEC5031764.1 SH3 domain-containing protein [Oscillatoria sp. PMC 1051.18]